MGAVCTRACRFCAVDTGNPRGWLDAQEPDNVARSVALMNLKYVVLTSVNRDDLPDGGAGHYAAAIRTIKQLRPETAVEALTPDFQGKESDVAAFMPLVLINPQVVTLGEPEATFLKMGPPSRDNPDCK